ncbi:hypothetical protein EVAR_21418_1 [Eumeta japonica]|uniref:Uncharacterized protein n=1 Tax=Eumeta variegata TaxID=151549 RepID=A0A4C1VGW5_EUMVA|nr:hypothetical protein EVAR_21418_1 [Eumeta japonica]
MTLIEQTSRRPSPVHGAPPAQRCWAPGGRALRDCSHTKGNLYALFLSLWRIFDGFSRKISSKLEFDFLHFTSAIVIPGDDDKFHIEFRRRVDTIRSGSRLRRLRLRRARYEEGSPSLVSRMRRKLTLKTNGRRPFELPAQRHRPINRIGGAERFQRLKNALSAGARAAAGETRPHQIHAVQDRVRNHHRPLILDSWSTRGPSARAALRRFYADSLKGNTSLGSDRSHASISPQTTGSIYGRALPPYAVFYNL